MKVKVIRSFDCAFLDFSCTALASVGSLERNKESPFSYSGMCLWSRSEYCLHFSRAHAETESDLPCITETLFRVFVLIVSENAVVSIYIGAYDEVSSIIGHWDVFNSQVRRLYLSTFVNV